MKTSNRKLHIILFSAILMISFSGTIFADAGMLQNKLDQCKQQFAVSQDKNVTQKEALSAKLNHLKLMKEILVEMNQKNTGKDMSAKEMQSHMMVISHLMQMMVTEDLANKMYDLDVHY